MASNVGELLLLNNPWLADPDRQAEAIAARLPSPLIPRATSATFSAERVLLVVGPRQAGKSTLLLDLARRVDRPVVVLNAEEPAIRDMCRSPSEVLLWLSREVVDRPSLLLFEEVQHLDEAGLFLKGLVDARSGHLLAATGSSSYHLRAKTRESLTGRADRVTLLPFSHAEVTAEGAALPPIARLQRARDAWQRQVVFGSYPAVWRAAEPARELARLAEAFVIRDASDLYRIEHLDAFRKVVRLAAADSGQVVNLSTWATEAGVARDTVARYLDLLEESHVVRRIRPFLGGKRAEIKAATKVYFLDCGLRNVVFGGFGPLETRADAGALAETWVFSEIAKATGLLDVVAFWRTRNGAEVDFVVERGSERIGVEVKLAALREPRLPRSARDFVALYRPSRFILVNRELTADAESDGVPISFCRPWELAPHLERAD